MNKRQQKRRHQRLAAFKPLKQYIYEPGKSSVVDKLVAEIQSNGWTVEFPKWCEDTRTPGMLGNYAGVTDHDRRTIKVKTMDAGESQVIAVLEHEIEHMNGAEFGTDHPLLGLKCGGRTNAFGETVSRNDR